MLLILQIQYCSNMLCTKCGSDQPEGNFNWRNKAQGLRHRRCKTCQSKQDSATYVNSPDRAKKIKAQRHADRERNRGYVQNYLTTHGCVDCPEADPACLDFDHVRGEKTTEISQMVRRGFALEKLIGEIEKCDVRCANCHRKITAKRRIGGTGRNRTDISGFSSQR